ADAQVLLWGGTTLASRAARRVADALREATGRLALAADADALLPVLASAAPRDPFADPFLDGDPDQFLLVLFDDRVDEPWIRQARGELTAAAERQDVRVIELGCDGGSDLSRYAALRQRGLYGATYLALGLGQFSSRSDRWI